MLLFDHKLMGEAYVLNADIACYKSAYLTNPIR